MLLAKTLRSSTLRLALICIASFGVAVLALFGYVYWSTASFVLSRADESIAAERAALRDTYDAGGRAALADAIAQRVGDRRLDDRVYVFADSSFTPVAGNLAAWPPALKGETGRATVKTPDWKPGSGQNAVLRVSQETLPTGEHLLVGRDIGDLAAFAGRIKTALTLAIALTFMLAGVASLAVTRRTVGRIESINAASRAIMQSGLGERIPLRGTQDEWDQLAENLNLMLDRIEALMDEVKQVTDNVAHDLRTPLARIRGRLEKASTRRRNPEDDRAVIGDTLADLDGVLRMFTSLTRISQIETRDRTAAFRRVDLAELTAAVAELFDAAAEDRGIALTTSADPDVSVTGDRDLLFDAMANLVDNAIKHGRAAGRVTLAVSAGDGAPVISIADDGPGIPAHELPHVFKRFYRLERSRRTPGNGLGLSLVAAVARLHGARVDMRNRAPGLDVRLQFPRPASALQPPEAPEAAAAPPVPS